MQTVNVKSVYVPFGHLPHRKPAVLYHCDVSEAHEYMLTCSVVHTLRFRLVVLKEASSEVPRL